MSFIWKPGRQKIVLYRYLGLHLFQLDLHWFSSSLNIHFALHYLSDYELFDCWVENECRHIQGNIAYLLISSVIHYYFPLFKADGLSWRKKITDDNSEYYSPSANIPQDMSVLFYPTEIPHEYCRAIFFIQTICTNVYTIWTTFWCRASLKVIIHVLKFHRNRSAFFGRTPWQMFKLRNLSILFY